MAFLYCVSACVLQAPQGHDIVDHRSTTNIFDFFVRVRLSGRIIIAIFIDTMIGSKYLARIWIVSSMKRSDVSIQ